MDSSKKKVLIVEDSQVMAQLLRTVLINEDFLVEHARNGQEAVEKAKAFKPDVITMDIEMPVMSGLEALEIIMTQSPVPVIMVSAQTIRGAEISLRALEMGAFDIVTKPTGDLHNDADSFRRELVTKAKIALLVPPEKLRKPSARYPSRVLTIPSTGSRIPNPIVLIGTSTGGPTALQMVLTQLPKDFPAPVLVVQHMPQNFTKLMAERLDNLCPMHVKEAADGDVVVAGKVLVAPGGMQMVLAEEGAQLVTKILPESPISTPYKPSVNVLFNSAEQYADRVIALVLTGMGSDGLDGARLLKGKGACIVAESEETCIVYGMSKCIADAGLADKVLPLSEIGKYLMQKVYTCERSLGDEC
ncbi:MAG TPA: chemotaxis response regulator protein-glutamate methylesterase [Verrucomicrobiae bacterium]|nr:chemotaxis response regulator protein-glutamate methylesterase [Verrucomicrobiae bacterium]